MSSNSTVRLVVSGTRSIRDTELIRTVLRSAYAHILRRTGQYPTLVHGGAPGVDRIASSIIQLASLPVEHVPAKWGKRGTPEYDRGAGFKRNIAMLSLEGVVGLVAFHADRSPGTEQCVKAAVARGIPVWYVLVEGGVAQAPISVTKANVASVFPPFKVEPVPGETEAALQAAEVTPIPAEITLPLTEPVASAPAHVLAGPSMYYDPVVGQARCGHCGTILHM